VSAGSPLRIARTLYAPEHEAFRDMVRRFVAAEIAPHLLEWEELGVTPRALWRKGGAAGILVARVALAWLVSMAPPDLPRLGAVALDGTVLLFTAGATLLSGLLFGMAPAVRTLRTDLATVLQSQGGRDPTVGAARSDHRVILCLRRKAGA